MLPPRAEAGIAESGRAAGEPQEHFVAAPREFHAAPAGAPPIAPPMPPRAISEILEPHAAPPRAAIEPDLPPDHPLEPGTRPSARAASPSERIAASESALSEIPAGTEGAGQLVELHRRRPPRRAGCRRRAGPPSKAGRSTRPRRAKAKVGDKAKKPTQGTLDHHLEDPLAAGRRQRGRDRARHLQDGDDAARHRQRAADAGDGRAGEPGRPGARPPNARKPAMPAPAAPSMTSPTPIGRQSNHTPAPNMLDSRAARDPASTGGRWSPRNDITGTIPPRGGRAGHDHARQDRHGAGAADRKTAGRHRRTGAARRRS